MRTGVRVVETLDKMIKIKEQSYKIENEYNRYTYLLEDLEKLIDWTITYYYRGNLMYDWLEEKHPNWKLEYQEIIDNPDHEVFKNAGYETKCEIFDLALVESDINQVIDEINITTELKEEARKEEIKEVRRRNMELR